MKWSRELKPDNTWVTDSNVNYKVSSNGTYTFVVEDNAGRITNKSIEISNIDNILQMNSLKQANSISEITVSGKL